MRLPGSDGKASGVASPRAGGGEETRGRYEGRILWPLYFSRGWGGRSVLIAATSSPLPPTSSPAPAPNASTIVVNVTSSGSGGSTAPLWAAGVTGVVLILVAILNNWYMGRRQREEQENAQREAKNDRDAAEKRAADDRAILEANALKVAQSAQVTNLLATYKWAVELAFDENASKSVLGVEVLSVLGSLPAGSFGEGGTEIVAQTLVFIQDGYTEHPDPGDSSEAYPRGSSGSSGDGGSNA